MSNYPDNFNSKAFDDAWGDDILDDILPADMANVRNAQYAYKECMTACVDIFKKRGLTYISKNELDCIAESVAEAMNSAVSQERGNIADYGGYAKVDEDYNGFLASLYMDLKGKAATHPAVMFAEELKSNRIVTNPATNNYGE